METVKIKKGDTSPALAATLTYPWPNGASIVDLTGATSVYFNMGNVTDYTPYTSGLAVITGSTTGDCKFNWTTISTSSVGTYWGEFQVNWTGSRMTIPNDHNLKIEVFEDYD